MSARSSVAGDLSSTPPYTPNASATGPAATLSTMNGVSAPPVNSGATSPPSLARDNQLTCGSALRPLGLLDLNDDCLRLVAGQCYKEDWTAGLLGASTRPRRAVMEAMPLLIIKWRCPCGKPATVNAADATQTGGGRGSCDGGGSDGDGDTGGGASDHSRCALLHAEWLAAVLSMLPQAVRLLAVELLDEEPSTGAPSCDMSVDTTACTVSRDRRRAAWRSIGAALRTTAVTEVLALGNVVVPAFGAWGVGGGGRPLQTLRLRVGGDDLDGLSAAVAAVALTLETFELCALGDLSTAVIAVLPASGAYVFPAVRTLGIFGNHLVDTLSPAAAAAVVAAFPRTDRLVLVCHLGEGAGETLALTLDALVVADDTLTVDNGALPWVTSMVVDSETWQEQNYDIRGLEAMLLGRRLDDFKLSVMTPGGADAVLSLAHFPVTLNLEASGLDQAACVQVLSDRRAAARLERLLVTPTVSATDILGDLPLLPRLRSLTIEESYPYDRDRAAVPPSWAKPPALAELRLNVHQRRPPTSMTPPLPQPALVGWLLRRVVASAAVATMTSVNVRGTHYLSEDLLEAVASLAAAPALRSLELIHDNMPSAARADAVAVGRLHASLPRVATQVRYTEDAY